MTVQNIFKRKRDLGHGLSGRATKNKALNSNPSTAKKITKYYTDTLCHVYVCHINIATKSKV
jgi:hypothetical protein